jgi:hypothetical protein
LGVSTTKFWYGRGMNVMKISQKLEKLKVKLYRENYVICFSGIVEIRGHFLFGLARMQLLDWARRKCSCFFGQLSQAGISSAL